MKTCLVIDDTSFDRELMKSGAMKLGFSVTAVGSAKEGLELCAHAMPDCILLDWEMPEMNGIEVLKSLRTMPGGMDAVIIICTSHQSPSHIGHAFAKGASDYIAKPASVERLERKFREAGLLPPQSASGN